MVLEAGMINLLIRYEVDYGHVAPMLGLN